MDTSRTGDKDGGAARSADPENAEAAGGGGRDDAAHGDGPKQPTMADVLPWKGKATFTDKALLTAILGVVALMLLMLPLRPYMLASHPVVLEFLTGAKSAVGAAAAFARVGDIPLWLVVVAGTVGMVKFDWLFWWTGRQWGEGIVSLFAPSDNAKRFAAKAQHMNPWIIGGAVAASYLPGVPSALVFAIAGWTGMRLITFLLWNALGAGAMTGLVTWLGYSLGQYAVDFVLLIDRYALWVSLVIIVGLAVVPAVRAERKAKREAAAKTTAGTSTDADAGTDRGTDTAGGGADASADGTSVQQRDRSTDGPPN